MFSICTLIDSLNAARPGRRELGREPPPLFAYIWSQLKAPKRFPVSNGALASSWRSASDSALLWNIKTSTPQFASAKKIAYFLWRSR